MIFAIDRAGLVGEDGPTHHGAFDFSYLRHIPNLIIMAPADENELVDMLYSAFSMEGPVSDQVSPGVGRESGLSRTPVAGAGQSRLIVEGRIWPLLP